MLSSACCFMQAPAAQPEVPGYQGESGTSCGAGLNLNGFAQQAMKDSRLHSRAKTSFRFVSEN